MAERAWFTVGEAADYLRLSKPSIYRLVTSGVLTAYTIGEKGEQRFKREDLDAVLQRREPQPRESSQAGHKRTAVAA